VTQALLITLREGLEVALMVVIVLAYLKKTGRTRHFVSVWQGTVAAVAVSIVAGGLLFGFGSGLSGKAEEVFEGSAMLLAVVVLTWMVIWMKSQARGLRGKIETDVERAVAGGSSIALAFLAFVLVVREGLETVLFLFGGSDETSLAATAIGGLLGLVAAVAIGRLVYQGSRSIPLRQLFSVTGVLLILFAAGLLAHGLHEFQEAGYMNVLVDEVWDTNGIVDEDGDAGGLLKGLFGYNGNPSLLEVLAYPTYLLLALAFFLMPSRRAAESPRRRGAVATSD
jgi:high-affinity iron transporter